MYPFNNFLSNLAYETFFLPLVEEKHTYILCISLISGLIQSHKRFLVGLYIRSLYLRGGAYIRNHFLLAFWWAYIWGTLYLEGLYSEFYCIYRKYEHLFISQHFSNLNVTDALLHLKAKVFLPLYWTVKRDNDLSNHANNLCFVYSFWSNTLLLIRIVIE